MSGKAAEGAWPSVTLSRRKLCPNALVVSDFHHGPLSKWESEIYLPASISTELAEAIEQHRRGCAAYPPSPNADEHLYEALARYREQVSE